MHINIFCSRYLNGVILTLLFISDPISNPTANSIGFTFKPIWNPTVFYKQLSLIHHQSPLAWISMRSSYHISLPSCFPAIYSQQSSWSHLLKTVRSWHSSAQNSAKLSLFHLTVGLEILHNPPNFPLSGCLCEYPHCLSTSLLILFQAFWSSHCLPNMLILRGCALPLLSDWNILHSDIYIDHSLKSFKSLFHEISNYLPRLNFQPAVVTLLLEIGLTVLYFLFLTYFSCMSSILCLSPSARM